MLFVHNEKSSALAHQKHQQQQQEKHRLSPPNRPSDASKPPSRKRFLDTLLDTFHDWEGTTRASGGFLDGTLPSGRMSVDFMHYRTGGQGVEDEVSVYHHSLGGKSVRTASSSSTAVGSGGGSGVAVNVHGVEGGDGDDDERPDSAKTLTGPHVYEVAQVARPVSARIVTTHGSQGSQSSQDMGFRFDFGQPGGMI